MLFSATQTKKVEALTALALKNEPVYVGVDDHREQATVDSLEQGCVNRDYSFITILYININIIQKNCLL